jgi:hypothetical protein
MIASLKISVVVHGLHKGEYRYVPEHGGPEIGRQVPQTHTQAMTRKHFMD